MASISKSGDVVILDNNESYFVIDVVEFNDKSYLKIGNTISTNPNEEPEYVTGFVKEEVSQDGKYSLAIVTNPKLIEELNSIVKQYSSERVGN